MKKVALITGASGGIGEHFARIHAAQGGDLVLVARSEGKLNTLAEELQQKHNVHVEVLTQDLSETAAVQAVYDYIEEQNIVIEYLINNAGFGTYGSFIKTSWTSEANMIDLNVRSLTQFCKLFTPIMARRGHGKILNVASTASYQPGPFMAVYFATKHYVLAFSDALAEELKGTGVTVTTLCPGPTASGFQEEANMQNAKMVKGKKLPGAKEVAEFGYQKMRDGKRVVVHGAVNRIMVGFAKMMPTALGSAITRKITE